MARKSITDIEAQQRRLLNRLVENSDNPNSYQRALRVVQAGDRYIGNIEKSKGYKRNEERATNKFAETAIASGRPHLYTLDNLGNLVDNVRSYKAGRNVYMGLSIK